MGKLTGDKSYFNKVCLYRFLLVWSSISGDENVSFLLVLGVLSSTVRRKSGSAEHSFDSLDLAQ